MMNNFEAMTLRDAIVTKDKQGKPAPVAVEVPTDTSMPRLIGKMEDRGLIIIDRWEHLGDYIAIVYRLSA